jgi:hypothetical protein
MVRLIHLLPGNPEYPRDTFAGKIHSCGIGTVSNENRRNTNGIGSFRMGKDESDDRRRRDNKMSNTM